MIAYYSTLYITSDVRVYARFQSSKAFEDLAIVPQKRKTPVRSVEMAKVPFPNPQTNES